MRKMEDTQSKEVEDSKNGGRVLAFDSLRDIFAFVWGIERALALGTWIYPHQTTAVLAFIICFSDCKSWEEDNSYWRPGWASNIDV